MKKLVLMLCFVCLACQMGWGQASLTWAKKIGGFGNNTDQGRDIFTDASGNVYTTGYFVGTADFDPNAGVVLLASVGIVDAFIQKLDANGDLIWAKNIGGTLTSDGIRVQVDNVGNVYVMGNFRGNIDLDPNAGVVNATSNGNDDIFIIKLDSNGNLVWGKTFGGSGLDVGGDILLDNIGNLYVTGYFQANVDFDPNAGVFNMTVTGTGGFLQKLDVNGNFIWAKKIGGNGFESGISISLETSGNIILTGYFQGTTDFDPNAGVVNLTPSGLQDVFVLKLSGNGDYIWVKKIGGSAITFASKVYTGLSGDLYISGYFTETVDFDPNAGVLNITAVGMFDMFLLKLNNSGNLIWAKSMGGIGEDYIQDIVLDNCENIYATGAFKNSVDFDPNAGISTFTSNGFDDIFVQKLDKNGNLLWVNRIGGTSIDMALGIALQADNVHLTGFFYDTVNFNPNIGIPFELTASADDIFIVKYSQTNVSLNPSLSFLPVSPTLTPFSTTCIASAPQSFQVKGENLNGNLVITAPTGYEISLTSGGAYSSSLNITPSCGTVLPTTIFIRLKAGLTVGAYNGNVVLSSTGATSQNLAVTGTVQENDVVISIGLANSYCLNAPNQPITFTWMSPSGLTLGATPPIITVNNASSNTFIPSTLGVGSHTVKVTLIDVNGCPKTATNVVQVLPLPTLSNNVNLSYSTNQIGFTIFGLPTGSAFAIVGNPNPITVFNPSALGAGTHTLVQTATVNGCTNTLTKIITITEPLTLTSTAGATCWKNAVVNVDANIAITSTTTMTGAIVSFGAGYNSTQDRLIYPIPMFGVTGSFDVPTGVLKLTGTATTAQYQQILRSIQYHNISASPAYGTTRTINFTAGDVLPLYPCGSADAHFYKFIPAPAITWQNAKIAAEAQNYFGMKGYLATISCTQENNFAFNSIAQKGWIGASDDVAFTGAYSPNGEGQWYWVTGPEAGTRFWQGNQPGSPVGGLYNNWDAGEPNNWQNTNESFAHLLESGRWNDYAFNNSSIVGYFIEFGGLPTDPNVQTTTSKQIQIATKPDFFISGQVCIDAAPIALTGSPTGGTFKINGVTVSDATLKPDDLGVGAHTVVYELAGCTIPTSKVVNVTPLPTVSISGLQASYCVDVATVALTGSPAGGTFTINGGVATQFSPSTAGAGNYTIKYTYTNGNGCKNSATQNVVVAPLPTAQLTGLSNTYCITQASFPLQGIPAGGTFKINAFDATVFDAQTLGAGIYTVTYTVSNGICNDTDQKIVEVVAPPTISFDNVPNEYCSQAVPITLQASPVGGTFTINGVATNLFNPADYAIGDEVVIKYEYGILAGCSSSLTKTIKVVFSSSFEQASFDWEVCPSGTAGEPLEALSAGEEQDLNTLNGNLRYEWSNGETSRVIFITEQGTYKVLVKSGAGCPLRDYTFNASIICDTKFFIPTAFTPNGDGRNDKWEIFGNDVTKLDLRVYNRWGELVFVSNSMEKWWDGTAGGKPAPEGVYAWTVSYENPLKKGVVEKKQGTVTILR